MKLNNDNIVATMEEAIDKLKNAPITRTEQVGFIYSEDKKDVVIIASKEGKKQVKKILNDIS